MTNSETFKFSDAVISHGVVLPDSELITAEITINKNATGGDNPEARQLIERHLRVLAAVLTMYGTNVYDEFVAMLEELSAKYHQICAGVAFHDPAQLSLFEGLTNDLFDPTDLD